MKSRILELQEQYKNNITTPQKEYEKALKKLNDIKHLNASLTTVDFKYVKSNGNYSLLDGIIYSLKDNIATKNIKTTGGSKFLENYVPPYNSTVKTILDQNNAILISKDNLDEFGLGGLGVFSGFGHVYNSIDKNRITGGSSSGSSVLVKEGVVAFAIGTDTGDSIRKPASYMGVYGYKPTYGLISRYGVYPYSPSLDHVGIIANSLIDISIVLSYLVKKDQKDFSSTQIDDNNFYHQLKSVKKIKIAIFKDTLKYLEKEEYDAFINYIKKIEKIFDVEYIEFNEKLLKLIDPIYKAISYSEAYTCYANLNGILFGNKIDGKTFEDISIKSRTAFFGKQLKRRFVIGSYATSIANFDKVFLKSKKIRTLIINRVNEIFDKYDAYILPGASSIAPLIKDIESNLNISRVCDDALQIANFAGLPSLTIPAYEIDNFPIGINITCKQKNDQLVLNIAKTIIESVSE